MSDRQVLIPDEIAAQLPPLYTNEDKDLDDVLVVVRLFNPYGAGTWFLTEYDPVERIAFGYATYGDLDDPCAEWGYITIDELEAAPAFILGRTIPGIQGIERDEHFTAKSWREVKAEWQRERGQPDEVTELKPDTDPGGQAVVDAFEEE